MKSNQEQMERVGRYLSGQATDEEAQQLEASLFKNPQLRTALLSGQVVVRVPENAIGFELDSPAARVVDLGTEFAINVGPNLETDLQVFEGAVAATGARSGFPSRMEAGTASRFNLEATSLPLKLEFANGSTYYRWHNVMASSQDCTHAERWQTQSLANHGNQAVRHRVWNRGSDRSQSNDRVWPWVASA